MPLIFFYSQLWNKCVANLTPETKRTDFDTFLSIFDHFKDHFFQFRFKKKARRAITCSKPLWWNCVEVVFIDAPCYNNKRIIWNLHNRKTQYKTRFRFEISHIASRTFWHFISAGRYSQNACISVALNRNTSYSYRFHEIWVLKIAWTVWKLGQRPKILPNQRSKYRSGKTFFFMKTDNLSISETQCHNS